MVSRKILMVDDEKAILDTFTRVLRNKFDITTSLGPAQALDIIRGSKEPFAVIVTDFMMPEMNGNEFLLKANELSPISIKIMLTGQAGYSDAIKAINEGKIFRFLNKPCTHNVLERALNAGLEQFRLISSEKELVEKTLKGSIKMFIDVLALARPDIFKNAVEIRSIARQVAKELKIVNTWKIELAAMFSQIGNITLPADILEKLYSQKDLSDVEKSVIEQSFSMCKSVISSIPRLESVADNVEELSYFSGSENFYNQSIVSKIVRISTHYVSLKNKLKSSEKAFDEMKISEEIYEPSFFEALFEAVKKSPVTENIVKTKISDIKTGMKLTNDVVDIHGNLVVPANTVVNHILHTKLLNFAKLKKIDNYVNIFT